MQLPWVLRARRGVDVRLCTLLDLEGELVGAREVEAGVGIQLLEDAGERGRRVDRERLALATAAARGEEHEGSDRREPSHRSIRTDVAFTTAVAEAPGFSSSWSAASRVITATTR